MVGSAYHDDNTFDPVFQSLVTLQLPVVSDMRPLARKHGSTM